MTAKRGHERWSVSFATRGRGARLITTGVDDLRAQARAPSPVRLVPDEVPREVVR
jgi:hypothetical protein